MSWWRALWQRRAASDGSRTPGMLSIDDIAELRTLLVEPSLHIAKLVGARDEGAQLEVLLLIVQDIDKVVGGVNWLCRERFGIDFSDERPGEPRPAEAWDTLRLR